MKKHTRRAHDHRYWCGKKGDKKHLEVRHLNDMNIEGSEREQKVEKKGCWIGENAKEKNISFEPRFLDIYTSKKTSFKASEFDGEMLYIANTYMKYLNKEWLIQLVRQNFKDHVDAYFGESVHWQMVSGYLEPILFELNHVIAKEALSECGTQI